MCVGAVGEADGCFRLEKTSLSAVTSELKSEGGRKQVWGKCPRRVHSAPALRPEQAAYVACAKIFQEASVARAE